MKKNVVKMYVKEINIEIFKENVVFYNSKKWDKETKEVKEILDKDGKPIRVSKNSYIFKANFGSTTKLVKYFGDAKFVHPRDAQGNQKPIMLRNVVFYFKKENWGGQWHESMIMCDWTGRLMNETTEKQHKEKEDMDIDKAMELIDNNSKEAKATKKSEPSNEGFDFDDIYGEGN